MQSLAALNARAWRVLIDHLGVDDALRFIGQFDMGSGNYATDRDAWQEGMTVQQISADIRRRKAKKKPAPNVKPRSKKPARSR